MACDPEHPASFLTASLRSLGPVLGPRYRLLESLGAGGQGEVWRVEDLHHRGARRVLKAIRGEARGIASVELAHEFERLAGLDHAALPRVRDLGVLDHD